jgi:sugar/nucleoside kinase (ribokinase family)
VESTIVVATQTGTRNVFSHSPGNTGAHDTLPSAEVIRAARVLLLDHHGIPGAIRAAQIAREAGCSVVADFERDDAVRFPELLALVDHLILSEGFARRFTSADSPAEAIARLWSPERQVVVVTCGAEGCWSASAATPKPAHTPSFRVEVIDTTSCGDVFHGAYAAAIAGGMETEDRIRFASAAAALKASRHSATDPLPTRPEVEALLRG